MHAVILALVLQGAVGAGPADAGSLGIGIDVLPEAFSFAASRAGYAPRMRLGRCDAHVCRWHLGDGVEMAARLAQPSLSVDRVEAELDDPGSADARAGYRMACLAIVSLFDPRASEPRRRSIAAAIARPPEDAPQVAMRTSGADTSFYGARERCGAAAGAIDVASPL